MHASKLLARKNLHGEKAERTTLNLVFECDLLYNPGDHLGVFARNRPELVDKILNKLIRAENPNEVVQLQVLQENHTPNGKNFTQKNEN